MCLVFFPDIWYYAFPNVLFCKRVHMVHGGPWGAPTFPPNAVIKRNTRCHQGGNHIKSGPNCQTNWTAEPGWVFSFLHVILGLFAFHSFLYRFILHIWRWGWWNDTSTLMFLFGDIASLKHMDLTPPSPPSHTLHSPSKENGLSPLHGIPGSI